LKKFNSRKFVWKKKYEAMMLVVVEIRMKSAAAGKTRFFDPPRMIFAA